MIDGMSRLILGTAQLGMDYGIANTSGKPGEELSLDIIKTALRAGITVFDTASSYGDSEDMLGRFLSKEKDLVKGEVEIVSKLPKIGPSLDIDLEGILNIIREHVLGSIKRLGVDKIDVYLLHDAENIESHSGNVVSKLPDISML